MVNRNPTAGIKGVYRPSTGDFRCRCAGGASLRGGGLRHGLAVACEPALLLLLYTLGLRRSGRRSCAGRIFSKGFTTVRVAAKGDKDEGAARDGRAVASETMVYGARVSAEFGGAGSTAAWCFYRTMAGVRLGAEYTKVKDYLGVVTTQSYRWPHVLLQAATHMLEDGADILSIKELLGHSSLSSTQVYTHVGGGTMRTPTSKAHPHARKRSRAGKQ